MEVAPASYIFLIAFVLMFKSSVRQEYRYMDVCATVF
jgi:hypothetical protein